MIDQVDFRFADGRLIETALDGSESVWGEVITWDPPHSFSMTWHPGRQEGPTSTVAVEFRPEGDGTTVRLEHRGWEAFGADASARRRSMVGRSAWGHVLDHFTDSAEV